MRRVDIAVVGAGAAGLMAAVQAGREARVRGERVSVIALDSAKRLGAKILVSGGGRCNVTYHEVDERAFSGSTAPAIRRVLRRFSVAETTKFFGDLGVALKREATGKLFPVSDRARTVLDAMIRAAEEAGVELHHPWRVESVARAGEDGFLVAGPEGEMKAGRVILATGGMSLPKSGSDGHGYSIARSLGHTITDRILPALVPLTLDASSFVLGLPGIATDASLEVRTSSGRRLIRMQGPILCTHVGLSGPVVLDISRHLLHARLNDPGAHLLVGWVPEAAPRPGRAIEPWLRSQVPERLARALILDAGIDGSLPPDRLSGEARRRLERTLTAWRAPVTGTTGFAKAEVTAGGVPLSEATLATLESRVAPGLHLCGEILDVDGRIGGFNFQWAWASGFVAGYSSLSGGITPAASR